MGSFDLVSCGEKMIVCGFFLILTFFKASCVPLIPVSEHLLPSNPCETHHCPDDQVCHLTRPPCFLFCDLVPSCKTSTPVYPAGRETYPTTMQNTKIYSRKRPENRIENTSPPFIKSLVKGVSTGLIKQKPFYRALPEERSQMMKKHGNQRSNRRSGNDGPLVFISTINNNILARRSNSPEEEAVRKIFAKKPFYRVSGPGLVKPESKEAVDINFDNAKFEQKLQGRNFRAPMLGVKSIYETQPWTETVDIVNENKENKLTYQKAIQVLDTKKIDGTKNIAGNHKNTVIVDYDGFQPKDHVKLQKMTNN